jgi:hypothetical protein
MAFHKHGIYSFQVTIQRMMVIGGHNFVADVTALRRHGLSGAAQPLQVPAIDEQYGETAQEAEGDAVKAMAEWLDHHSLLLVAPGEAERSDGQYQRHQDDHRPERAS